MNKTTGYMEARIERYHREQREARNRALRARLMQNCSTEELLRDLSSLAPRREERAS